eukprot:CAMPEP_0172402744 /NCGR_PEP_ID=MMETSP1061-20121228/55948_1 /TAXON_ID=37318 /ORGANISM="Pseudo-nitzschia pungens, Strain cf. pungens" /LENGTH=199 /DNA_ID=CAMNT_0013136861 /DNA_START=22 /DNA_END=621 /DNA_ORIENTATION=+
MSQTQNYEIPHVTLQTLIEVGAVVGVFLLAIGCMAITLDQRPGDEENRGCCSRFTLLWNWCKRRLRRNNEDDEDEDESYIDDEESGRPAPHVFDTLNEMVFFLAPDDDDDEAPAFVATPIRRSRNSSGSDGNDDDDENGVTTTTTMNQIFPDLLARPSSRNTSGSGVREEGGETRSATAGGDATDGEVSTNDDLREPLL